MVRIHDKFYLSERILGTVHVTYSEHVVNPSKLSLAALSGIGEAYKSIVVVEVNATLWQELRANRPVHKAVRRSDNQECTLCPLLRVLSRMSVQLVKSVLNTTGCTSNVSIASYSTMGRIRKGAGQHLVWSKIS